MYKPENIRTIENRDLVKLAVVIDQTELFPSEMLGEMIEPSFSDPESSDIWITYIHEDMPIAFAFCEPERMADGTWNILAIRVLPAFQGKGIGNMLMTYIENQLRNQNQRIVIVETSGLPEFKQTRKFYEKIGYTREARIHDFYDKGDDKIVFWKSLV